MLILLFYFFILLIIIFYFYIKLKFGFWIIQPVFHIYDLYYYFNNIGIINEDLPEKNKFTNFKNIKNFKFDDLNDKQINDFCFFIQNHFYNYREYKYFPKVNNIIPYFKNHNFNSYFSFYFESTLLIDNYVFNPLYEEANFIKNTNNNSNKIIENQKLIGVMTSRPLNVEIIDYLNNPINFKFDIYYVDYLCVHKYYRKKNIAPQIIQTHEYLQSHNNKKISISLFKREDNLTGIVPLTIYKSYIYNIKKWNNCKILNPKYNFIQGNKENLYYIYDKINFLKNESKNNNKINIIIIPELSNLIELSITNNIFIFFIKIEHNIEAIYIFKNSCVFDENNKQVYNNILSLKGNVSEEIFLLGFKKSILELKKKNKNFEYLIIEDLMNNNIIINSLKTIPIDIYNCAYFFYNFAYKTFHNNKVFIIN